MSGDAERLRKALVATVRIDAYRSSPFVAEEPDPDYSKVTAAVLAALAPREWRSAADGEHEDDILISMTEILPGYQMHVLALRVEMVDEAALVRPGLVVESGRIQQASGYGQDWFENLCALASPDGPFETTKIEGHDGEYVVWAEPFG